MNSGRDSEEESQAKCFLFPFLSIRHKTIWKKQKAIEKNSDDVRMKLTK
jgi:hypothetical protein